ncbi:D-alanyl-D-alanine carboxypeptidase family protein [Oceanobacillus alkalisoli]|uniref:D-alanyl-D-alanine carboxypeptidase family protein n=1 Tax=Oceanobacillus alkalisoli TaxID=2925113 RepID=UPI001F11D2B4|nr:D-alanyl-D-alanine carboxypeptidase family protein [Oceanobacillus alkalisoli]MCF3944828.1 D-alanyl-D-alanine carboxypeptidase family protein [Oceanobacillus alkalisoli]
MNKKSIIVTVFFTLILVLAACTDGEQTTNGQSNSEIDATKETDEEVKADDENSTLPNTELQKLDEGDAVTELQNILEQIGYTLPTDGIYSGITAWAITDIQLQLDDLDVTGIYDEATQLALERVLAGELTVESGDGLPPLAEPVTTGSGAIVVGNPYDQLAIINKERALPDDYIPHGLVVPDVSFPFEEDLPKKQLRAPAATALEELFNEAKETGHELFAQSGYRGYDTQVSLFHAYASEHGEEEANIFSARPGESEHQTGLSMDITSAAVGYQLTTDFGDTPEGEWVAENAHKFGFIIRYPEGKEDITQYQYEPWHLRYVGVRAATEMLENDQTMEEYFTENE